MVADAVNGIFELVGGLMIWLNVLRLYRDKRVAGVCVPVTVFFFAWGVWNLFFYPHLGQWVSFAGGLFIVAANAVWVALAVRYERAAVRELRDAVGRMARASRRELGGVREVRDGR